MTGVLTAKDKGVETEDEDLGTESETGTIALPPSMVQWLRVDLAVWRPDTPESEASASGTLILSAGRM